MEEEAELKKCPDCAESVLAAARKCRYCGYRFDGTDPNPPTGLLPELLGRVFTPPVRQTSVAATVAGWGAELEPTEEVAFFRLARIGRASGYVLVTDRRFCFFEQPRASRSRLTIDHPLTSVRAVQRGRRVPAGKLVLYGDGYEIVIRGLRRRELRELADAFRLD